MPPIERMTSIERKLNRMIVLAAINAVIIGVMVHVLRHGRKNV